MKVEPTKPEVNQGGEGGKEGREGEKEGRRGGGEEGRGGGERRRGGGEIPSTILCGLVVLIETFNCPVIFLALGNSSCSFKSNVT